jgi:hypothetical protein
MRDARTEPTRASRSERAAPLGKVFHIRYASSGNDFAD